MHLSYVSLISDEYQSLADFYTTALGLREHLSWQHEGFRALDAGGDTALAFHSPAAAAELSLPAGVRMMPTFDPGSVAELEAAAERLAAAGVEIRRPLFDTAYGARQAVYVDPLGNPFRLNTFR